MKLLPTKKAWCSIFLNNGTAVFFKATSVLSSLIKQQSLESKKSLLLFNIINGAVLFRALPQKKWLSRNTKNALLLHQDCCAVLHVGDEVWKKTTSTIINHPGHFRSHPQRGLEGYVCNIQFCNPPTLLFYACYFYQPKPLPELPTIMWTRRMRKPVPRLVACVDNVPQPLKLGCRLIWLSIWSTSNAMDHRIHMGYGGLKTITFVQILDSWTGVTSSFWIWELCQLLLQALRGFDMKSSNYATSLCVIAESTKN